MIRVIHIQTHVKKYLFGFRIDPIEKLRQLERQIFNFWRIYHDKPIFGVEIEEEDVSIVLRNIYRQLKRLMLQYKIMMICSYQF